MKKWYPYCVSVDWLQLYSKIIDPQKFTESRIGNFKLTIKNVQTVNYLKIATVFFFENKVSQVAKKFATITYAPRSSVLPPNACHVKLENEELYTNNFLKKLQKFYTQYNLQYISITRLDIAYDFNRLFNGVLPTKIIHDFFLQKILKIGVQTGYLNFNNFGYKIATGATRVSKDFKVGFPNINAITWGCKSSGNETQLYNKSLELRNKTYKPWIVDAWEAAGLNTSADVWRLEFRIQNRCKELQALESGDLFGLGINEIADQHRIEELFLAYAHKNFRFV